MAQKGLRGAFTAASRKLSSCSAAPVRARASAPAAVTEPGSAGIWLRSWCWERAAEAAGAAAGQHWDDHCCAAHGPASGRRARSIPACSWSTHRRVLPRPALAFSCACSGCLPAELPGLQQACWAAAAHSPLCVRMSCRPGKAERRSCRRGCRPGPGTASDPRCLAHSLQSAERTVHQHAAAPFYGVQSTGTPQRCPAAAPAASARQLGCRWSAGICFTLHVCTPAFGRRHSADRPGEPGARAAAHSCARLPPLTGASTAGVSSVRAFCMSRPATQGLRWCVTPSVEACALCAQPNASLTYRSACSASCASPAVSAPWQGLEHRF